MTVFSRVLIGLCCLSKLPSTTGTTLANEPVAVAAPASAESQLVEQGLDWRREVEADERALRLAFERLDQAIALITSENLYGERLTILQLRRVVQQMRRQAPLVVAAHRETLNATKAYGESVREAAPLLLAAAKRFEGYAEDEPYDELREDYRLWGESFQAIAKKYQQQEAYVPPTVATVSENLAYVVRTEKQLARVERLLDIVPEEGVGTEQFLTRLASYVESFAAFRKRLRALHQRTVGEETATPTPTAPSSNANDIAAAEADLLPLAVMVGAQRVRLSIDPLVGPASAVADDSAPVVPHPVHPLVGRWDLGAASDRIPLEVYKQSGELKLRLASKHRALSGVEGVVTGSGVRYLVRGLVYAMHTGERLQLGSCRLRVLNDDELSLTAPMVRGNFNRGFYKTKQSKTVKLYRVR